MRSSARTSTSLTLNSSDGVENIMCMKFALYERSFCGYTNGWPMLYLYAIATSVGSFAIMRIADTSR
ncbi:hypothetical protein LMG29739_01120 [Paraburkholderia solisilvae]|uniref:Uncharacterized protein n=1 Tax=Paraburkholderia solisilvae TaxID=624376 RepID=A0A6J5DBL4_9BURK|nr:hypothetical protein LMG29739_01120 [Paraburkholderia solisilvae]